MSTRKDDGSVHPVISALLSEARKSSHAGQFTVGNAATMARRAAEGRKRHWREWLAYKQKQAEERNNAE